MSAQVLSPNASVTESLFDDWVDKGLIGRPTVKIWPDQRHGSGSMAKWPQPQGSDTMDAIPNLV